MRVDTVRTQPRVDRIAPVVVFTVSHRLIVLGIFWPTASTRPRWVACLKPNRATDSTNSPGGSAGRKKRPLPSEIRSILKPLPEWTATTVSPGSTPPCESMTTRWENRFRLLMKEHWINPVLYVEFEHINGADKILKGIVGFDSWEDQVEPNSEARREKKREFETKLILSRDYRGWNFAGNAIAEKNLTDAPWEFGYALGVSRPLALAASPHACRFCRENFWRSEEHTSELQSQR